MSWHGQINRTIWEIGEAIKQSPESPRQRRELLRAQFLQLFEYDKAFHIPRDDRSFLFLHDRSRAHRAAPARIDRHAGRDARPRQPPLRQRHLRLLPALRAPAARRSDLVEGWVSQAQIAARSSLPARGRVRVRAEHGGTVSLILSGRIPIKG